MGRVIKFAFILILGGMVSVLVAALCSLLVDYGAMGTSELTNTRIDRLQQTWSDRRPANFPSQMTVGQSIERHGIGLTLSSIGTDDPALEHSVLHIRAGWPWPCLEGFRWKTRTFAPDPTLPGTIMVTGGGLIYDQVAFIRRNQVPIITLERPKLIPFGPIIPGLILNSLLYGLILMLLWKVFHGYRRRRLRRAGRCHACGYQLKDLTRCPECGTQKGNTGEDS